MPSLTLPTGSIVTYGDTGSGMPLVLVHGSPAEGRSWGRVVRALGDGLRVLTPDLPGHGTSTALPDTPAPARVDAMAEAVGALIQACDAPVYLCGHSFGGNVALHAAAANAGRVAGVLLLEPVFFRALALAGDIATLQPATTHFSEYVRRAGSGEPGAVTLMFDFWFGGGAYARLPAPVQQYLASAAPTNALDVAGSMADALPLETLTALRVPVVIACGSESPPVVSAIARSLAGFLPDAAVETISGATHGMVDTHPEQVARLIRRLIARPG